MIGGAKGVKVLEVLNLEKFNVNKIYCKGYIKRDELPLSCTSE